jgi:hypothetical protein
MAKEPRSTALAVALGVATKVIEEAAESVRDVAEANRQECGTERAPGQHHDPPWLRHPLRAIAAQALAQ